ncbi:MAG: hypothetical protein WA190_15805 [Usitatibacter sp.]
MEKKRSPIPDWRQVMRPGPKPRSVPLSRGKVVPRPPAVPLERSAKERWEDEGGHVAKAALIKPPIVGGE